MKVDQSIIQQEFIGLKTKVVLSSNPSCEGISGQILNETQKTFTILHKGRERTVEKKTTIFHFTLDKSTIVEIDGKALGGRPEDRAKRKFRRRW